MDYEAIAREHGWRINVARCTGTVSYTDGSEYVIAESWQDLCEYIGLC